MQSLQCCLPVREVFLALHKRSESADSIYYDCAEKRLDNASPAVSGHYASQGPSVQTSARIGKRPRREFPCCICRRRPDASLSSKAPSPVVKAEQPAPKEKAAVRRTDGTASPTLDALSEKKRQMVDDMRKLIEALPAAERPPWRHDLWLKRFLAHGKWKIVKAMQLYLEMESWRRTIGADKILTKDIDWKSNRVLPIDMIGFYPYSFDRLGRVCVWMRVGQTPWWRPLFERIEEGAPAQLWASEHFQARIDQHAKETGVWRERAVVIVDLRDLDWNYFQGLASSSRARRRGALLAVAQYYPGLVDKAYIVNAPAFANAAWSVLKQFLSKSLMEKAEMVSNFTEQLAMIREIGAEHVHRDLGGESTCPSYPLPEYLQMPSEGWSATLAAWRPREITIGASAQHVETISVRANGGIRLQWALTDFSILFETFWRLGDSEFVRRYSEEISFTGDEEPRYETMHMPEDGEIRLVWDNSLSKLRSKGLLLRIEVF